MWSNSYIVTNKGIWINLYEFPLIETQIEIEEDQLIGHEKFEELFENISTSIKLFNKDILVHKLSHQHIYTKFWVVNTQSSADFTLSWDAIKKYPVSSLIDNFINEYKTHWIF